MIRRIGVFYPQGSEPLYTAVCICTDPVVETEVSAWSAPYIAQQHILKLCGNCKAFYAVKHSGDTCFHSIPRLLLQCLAEA